MFGKQDQLEEELSTWDQFKQDISTELEQTQTTIRDISMMIQQSEVEANKLSERNKQLTIALQQAEKQFDKLSKAEIRSAYAGYLETKEKLFVMRGQLEKLQSDKNHLNRYVALLKKVNEIIANEEQDGGGGRKDKRGGMATLELIVQSMEEDRKRLSRQMHDGPAQALSNFIVQTEIAARCFEVDPSRAKEELATLKSAAMTTFQKVRGFIFELRPMMLDDLGLLPTVRRFVDSFRDQNEVNINLSIDGEEGRIEPYLEVMIFRALQELLSNAVHHNNDNLSTLQITVQLHLEDNLVKLFVMDNGKGFNVEEAAQGSGNGLKIIQERVDLVGGFFEIDTAPGQGCSIVFQVPCVRQKKVETMD